MRYEGELESRECARKILQLSCVRLYMLNYQLLRKGEYKSLVSILQLKHFEKSSSKGENEDMIFSGTKGIELT